MSNSFNFSDLPVEQCSSDEQAEVSLFVRSFGKRLGFARYHYKNLLDALSQPIGESDIFGSSESSVNNREIFEAEIDGFMLNLHCLLDSLPYLIWLLYPDAPKRMKPDKVYWHTIKNQDFFANCSWYPELVAITESDCFKGLKGYCNVSKHRFLPRIQKSTNLVSRKIRLLIEPEVNSPQCSYYDAVDFMRGCHDELIPKVLRLLDNISQSLKGTNRD